MEKSITITKMYLNSKFSYHFGTKKIPYSNKIQHVATNFSNLQINTRAHTHTHTHKHKHAHNNRNLETLL